MIIVPIGPILGVAGYIWSKKYLRYGTLAPVFIGGVAFISAMQRAQAKAGPYGLRSNDINFTDNHPSHGLTTGGTSGSQSSISRNAVISYFIGQGKDETTIKNAIDRYKNGWDYASGDDLLAYLDKLP